MLKLYKLKSIDYRVDVSQGSPNPTFLQYELKYILELKDLEAKVFFISILYNCVKDKLLSLQPVYTKICRQVIQTIK